MVDHVNQSENLDIVLSKLDSIYDLSTFGSSLFLLKVKLDKPLLVLKSKHNKDSWKERFFFMRRDFVPNGSSLPERRVKRVGFFIIIL